MNRQQGSVQMTKSSLHSCVPSLSLQSGAEGLMHRQELVGNAKANIQAIQSLLGGGRTVLRNEPFHRGETEVKEEEANALQSDGEWEE